MELSNRFAKSSQEKFAGLDVDIGLGGVPLLRGCSAWLQCRVFSRVLGGDHTIYLGEVHSIDRAERKPLVFGGGQYLRTDPHDRGAAAPQHPASTHHCMLDLDARAQDATIGRLRH
jgi:flavin reductase (DIM6/NTAB) family NADH-FMN oxidoreductase RutF